MTISPHPAPHSRTPFILWLTWPLLVLIASFMLEGRIAAVAYWCAAVLMLRAFLRTAAAMDLIAWRSAIRFIGLCVAGWCLAMLAVISVHAWRGQPPTWNGLGVALGWLLILLALLITARTLAAKLKTHAWAMTGGVLILAGALAGLAAPRQGEWVSYSNGQFLLPVLGFWPGFHRAIQPDEPIEVSLPARH